jgi:hypothetical protein
MVLCCHRGSGRDLGAIGMETIFPLKESHGTKIVLRCSKISASINCCLVFAVALVRLGGPPAFANQRLGRCCRPLAIAAWTVALVLEGQPAFTGRERGKQESGKEKRRTFHGEFEIL